MLQLPDPVLAYIHTLTIENRSPAYLLVENDGRLSSWGGELSAYGVTNLQTGKYLGEQVFFLEGLLPLDSSPLFLPCIETTKGLVADVHLFLEDEVYWVLLLDATLEENQRSIIQQKSNDLSLLRKKQSRLLSKHLGKEVNTNLAQEMLTIQVTGERKNVTVLVVDIRGFINYSESHPPDVVFKTLNLYLLSMIQPILDEAGMVDKIMGDAIMALFGLLPSTCSSQVQAVKAAIRIIEALQELGKVRKLENLLAFEVGIGIASGSVALGITDSKISKTFTAIGYHVNLATYLEQQAAPSEIIIDENTFDKIADLQTYFSPTSFLIKGTVAPILTYSYRGKL